MSTDATVSLHNHEPSKAFACPPLLNQKVRKEIKRVPTRKQLAVLYAGERLIRSNIDAWEGVGELAAQNLDTSRGASTRQL
jgi:hypothetical protein